jgi:hypothetical protein
MQEEKPLVLWLSVPATGGVKKRNTLGLFHPVFCSSNK